MLSNLATAYHFAVFEIHARFKRSVLGTLWYALSTLAIVLGLGPLYASIFGHPLDEYFGYLAFGLVFWNFFQGVISESTAVYQSNQTYIKDMVIHPIVFNVALIIKHSFIWFQNLVVVYGLLLLLGFGLAEPSLWFFVYMAPVIMVVFFGSVASSLISLRFRDFANIINLVVQIFFFLTPILWKTRPDILGLSVIKYNPVFYLVSLPRNLLLGEAVNLWVIAISWPVGLGCVWASFWVVRKYRKELVFWL